MEEVVVTARWREEPLRDTPVSVTVFGAEDLKARNVVRLDQLAAFTPNLVFDPGIGDTGGSTNAQVYMRGVGQADFLFTTEPGVGIYVDGVYMARAIGSMMDLVDVERVEILRGPQGTAFGRNSVGGAISIITRKPGDDPALRASVTAGSYDRVDVLGIADLPLVGNELLAKFTASLNKRDGYVKRVGGGRMGGIDSAGAGLQLHWRASEAFDLFLSADYMGRHETASVETLVGVNAAAPLLGLWNMLVGPFAGGPYDGRFVTGNPFLTNATGGNRSNLDQWGFSARAEWRGAAGTLKSITSYRRHTTYFATDADHSPLLYAEQSVTDGMNQVAQEFQWLGEALDGRLRYVVGGIYFSEAGNDRYRLAIAPGLYDALEMLPPGLIPGLGGAGNPLNATLDYNGQIASGIDSQSHALFAHADYSLTEALDISLGLRQTWDRKTYRARFDRFSSGTTAYNLTTSDTWQALTPSASLRYRWTAELMTYVSAARGYKSGGFNGRAQSAFVARTPFDPEYVWTYEAGLKSEWPALGAVFNLAAFHSDYTDLQLLSLSSDGAAPVVIAQNAGSVTADGFEAEAVVSPADDLRLNMGVGFVDAHYSRLAPNVTVVTPASELPKTPKWTFNIGAEYGFDAGPGRFLLRGDYAYRSTVRNDAANSAILTQQGYGIANLQLTFEPEASAWSIMVFVANLGDTRYVTNGLDTRDSIGIADVAYGRPREWGLKISRSF